jgi:hypothetical protein
VDSVTEQHGSVRSYKSGFDSRPAHQHYRLQSGCCDLVEVRALASAPGHVCFSLTEDVHGCRSATRCVTSTPSLNRVCFQCARSAKYGWNHKPAHFRHSRTKASANGIFTRSVQLLWNHGAGRGNLFPPFPRAAGKYHQFRKSAILMRVCPLSPSSQSRVASDDFR